MSANDSFTELDTTISTDPREQRRAFLITYSRVDIRKVPSCWRFSEIILEAVLVEESCSGPVVWRNMQTAASITTLLYFFR